MIDLSEKAALITGSSRGIGRAAAVMMARAGAKVCVSSRNEAACLSVVDEICRDGGQAIAMPCDVSNCRQIDGLAARIIEKYPDLSILVCNAAINPYYGPLCEIDEDLFSKIMATNVFAGFRLVKLLAPHMARAGGGSITFVGSIAPFFGSTTIGAYSVSKAAVAQMVRNLASELGPKNIRVNAIAPGLIKTDLSEALWNSDGGKSFVSRTPLRRIGEPEDISKVALFLASDLASFITGQTIVADGGALIADLFEK
jgi:NAD(P)-dependent dehydrogenase (short-subunit alcohol dehydrogenase family)